MSAELRFVLALTGVAAIAGAASVVGIYRQDAAQVRVQAEAMTGGRIEAGRATIGRYGCGSCHRIAGIPGAVGQAGPALDGIALRTQIAGRLPNRPDAMRLWLQHPQQVSPGTGMPDQGVTDRDARDMSAYLYTLRR